MPRYYFHIRDGMSLPDSEGVDLPDDHAAWSEAVRACGEALMEINGSLPPKSPWEMHVDNEATERIFELRFLTDAGPASSTMGDG